MEKQAQKTDRANKAHDRVSVRQEKAQNTRVLKIK